MMSWLLLLLVLPRTSIGLQPGGRSRVSAVRSSSKDEEYRSPVVELLGRNLKKRELDVDWTVPKATNLPPLEMAKRLEAGLREREWFVTGLILPELFSDSFKFEDTDVKIEGVKQYASGVSRLFDASARAQVISCELNNRIVKVTWRLSGGVNIGPLGLTLKPYVVYTDLHLDDTNGLVNFQQDRFSIPSWDILLSALLGPNIANNLPFLAPPAPDVDSS